MASLNAPTLGQAEGTTLLIGGAVALLAVLYVLRKAPAAIAGAASGKNALTANATNADGTPQTAYYGAGPAGTLGAATNAASGGWLSTLGDWIGTKLGDATISDPNAAANKADAAKALDSRPIDYGAPTDNPYGW